MQQAESDQIPAIIDRQASRGLVERDRPTAQIHQGALGWRLLPGLWRAAAQARHEQKRA